MPLKPYPKYKPSNSDWLGKIPVGWDSYRLKFVAQLQNTRTEEQSIDLNYLALEHIESGTGKVLEVSNTLEVDSVVSLFQKDDILFGKLRPYLAKVVHASFEGACTSELLVFRSSNSIFPRYLFYFLLSEPVINIANSFAYGTKMPRVNWEQIANLSVPIASLAEQQAIANFLDRETAVIDTLIAKKRELIERLHEKRTALISHAVTKGLDPATPMKDSGVEWLGKVPAHWQVIRLRFLLDGGLRNGIFKKRELFGTGTKLVNVSDVYRENFLVNFNRLGRVETTPEEARAFQVKPGDIFFVRSSLKLEGVGVSVSIDTVPEPTVFECHVVRARPDQKQIHPLFLIYYLNSSLARQRFIAFSETTTMTTIAQDRLSSIEISVPLMQDQIRIIEYIQKETSQITQLVSKIQDAIDRLQEYRTALISAAVTGKIDVRQSNKS